MGTETEISAWGMLLELFRCLGGSQCSLVSDADSGFAVAFVIALALNIGGIVLSCMGLLLATTLVTDRVADKTPAQVAFGSVAAFLWFYLWLAYALPESAGQSSTAWMVTTPLYTLVLMTGAIGMAAVTCFIAGSVMASHQPPGTPVRHPIARLSANRWAWGLLIAAVTGVLIGWHALYERTPEVAAGPFGRGPGWFQDALDVWTLHLPVTALWGLAQVLATVPGITAFVGLGVLSLVIPRPNAASGASKAATSSLVATITTATVGQVVALVAGTCVIIVVGLLAIAAVTLAFMFFAAYVMAYVMVLVFIGALVAKAVRR